jgi:hypothetical protein
MKVSKRENNVTKEEETQKVVKGDTGICYAREHPAHKLE